MRIPTAIAAVTVACSAASAGAAHPPDWTSDLRDDLAAAAWFSADGTRGFLRVNDHTSRIYRAWKAAAVDLDGDGTREIILGIWSDQPRHDEPNPHRTVWVLRWDDSRRELVEVWRGSALARPLIDFTIRDGRLEATERGTESCVRTTYAWSGFGFHGLKSNPIDCESP